MTLFASPGFASDAHVAVIEMLQQQGHTVESVQRTFLGRAKITVTIDGRTRQIIVSRSTGEVLHERTISTGSSGPNGSSNGVGNGGTSNSDDASDSSSNSSDNSNSGGNSDNSNSGGNSGNSNSGGNGNGNSGNSNSGGNGNGNSGGNGNGKK